jgi:ankyrin repeat protein
MSEPGNNSRFVQIRDAAFYDRDVAARLITEDRSILEARNGIGETALHFLVVENAHEAVDFLRANGATIDARNEFSSTPLMEAAALGYRDMCKYLIAHGADIRNKSARDGSTVFSRAAQHGGIDILRYLLDLLQTNEDINEYFPDVDAWLILEEDSDVAHLLRQRGLARKWIDETA